MDKKRKTDLIWAVSMIAVGGFAIVLAAVRIGNIDLSPTVKTIATALQLVAGVILIVTSVLRLKQMHS